jgi:uncharacterized membrane protein
MWVWRNGVGFFGIFGFLVLNYMFFAVMGQEFISRPYLKIAGDKKMD